ncbi:MAG: DUF1045 domain-containing protein [Pseudomonadota bacterium]
MFQRYAVYFTPDSELAQLGAAWLGWDCAHGLSIKPPRIEGIDDPHALTATPRKYGMHGTIKPPFFLASEKTAANLQEDFSALCCDLAPVSLPGLKVASLGRFLALVPQSASPELSDLAARVVRELDAYRAPPSDAELEKRRQARLTATQDVNLRTWGYPYVMDEFRFHITLTERISGPSDQIKQSLRTYFPKQLLEPFQIDSLTLVGQAADENFHEIVRFRLKGLP